MFIEAEDGKFYNTDKFISIEIEEFQEQIPHYRVVATLEQSEKVVVDSFSRPDGAEELLKSINSMVEIKAEDLLTVCDVCNGTGEKPEEPRTQFGRHTITIGKNCNHCGMKGFNFTPSGEAIFALIRKIKDLPGY